MPLEIVDDSRDSDFARNQTGLLFNLPLPGADREQLPVGLSLCMIVKNEERFLAECLSSVRDVVDEICIVDTGSTDSTVEIARSFGAVVAFHEWRNDFAWARNKALELATRRWTLVLDADEEIAPESLPMLRALRETPADETTVYLQIQNLVDDESGVGSTMTHILPRIFPTNPRLRYRGVIHENVVLDGAEYAPAVVSPILVHHKGYTTAILGERKKSERNQPLLERAIREADDPFSWFNFGTAAIVAGDTEAGIDALERMFAMPGPPRAYHGTAYAILASGYAEGRGDVERGIALLDKGLEIFPQHPNIMFMRGYFCSLAERYDEAREWYERSIEQRHDMRRHFLVDDEIAIWKAPLNIATTFLKEERFDEALSWLERARENKPDSAMLRGATARVYERVGRIYDAERLWREAVDRDGVRGLVAHVNFLMRRRRFAEAFERIDTRRDAFDDRSYRLLLDSAAASLREDDRLGDPEPYALRALALHPGDGLALRLLDELYAARGETEKRELLRATEMVAPLVDPADFSRRSHRLLENGAFADALAVARDGLAVEPGDDVLRYNAALAAARIGRDAEALDLLGSFAATDKHADAALGLQAEIAQRAGDLDTAVVSLERMYALDAPDTGLIRQTTLGVATALLEVGRVADAAKLAALALAS